MCPPGPSPCSAKALTTSYVELAGNRSQCPENPSGLKVCYLRLRLQMGPTSTRPSYRVREASKELPCRLPCCCVTDFLVTHRVTPESEPQTDQSNNCINVQLRVTSRSVVRGDSRATVSPAQVTDCTWKLPSWSSLQPGGSSIHRVNAPLPRNSVSLPSRFLSFHSPREGSWGILEVSALSRWVAFGHFHSHRGLAPPWRGSFHRKGSAG